MGNLGLMILYDGPIFEALLYRALYFGIAGAIVLRILMISVGHSSRGTVDTLLFYPLVN